jgi:hypothetical protein
LRGNFQCFAGTAMAGCMSSRLATAYERVRRQELMVEMEQL